MKNENIALVEEYLNLSWNEGEYGRLNKFIAPNFHYKTTFTDDILNLDQYIGFIKAFRKAMPDLMLDIDETMSDGNRVMTSISFSGIVESPFYGIPASDKIITFPAISLWSVLNGQITSLNTLIDISGIERQLGSDLSTSLPLKAR